MTYSRGIRSIALTAVIGETRREEENQGGQLKTESRFRDYLLLAADLVWSGESETFEPQIGDRITDGNLTFEAITLGNEVWRECDHEGKELRIHFQQIDVD